MGLNPHSQLNLVFSFNVKMDDAEVLAVWYLARKANKKCNRKLWVHPINQGRGEKGAYTLLHKELMGDCTKFFNCFRIMPSSFEELLEKVRSSIQMQDTHLRKSVTNFPRFSGKQRLFQLHRCGRRQAYSYCQAIT
jgi:hypothetical protein